MLAKNALYKQASVQPVDLNADDDVFIVHDCESNAIPTVESILCAHEHSGDLVFQCKEIVKGWPSSFVSGCPDSSARLAACYMIQFPSFMCYAITALRILSHAPWAEDMFHGHIRELVLCVIGKGWTCKD